MVRFIDSAGRELNLHGIADVVHAIESGALHDDSMVFDSAADRWVKATKHADCSALLSRIAVDRRSDHAPLPEPAAVAKTESAMSSPNGRAVALRRVTYALILLGFVALIAAALTMSGGIALARRAGASAVPLGIALLIVKIATGRTSGIRAWSYLAISIAFVVACVYGIIDLWQTNRAAEAVWEHFPQLRPAR